MASNSLLTCHICRDIFTDPWLSSDGFCYCLRCVLAWVAENSEQGAWISPRSNVRTPCLGALLGPDTERRLVCAEVRKARMLEALTSSAPLESLSDAVSLLSLRDAFSECPEVLRSSFEECRARPERVRLMDLYLLMQLCGAVGAWKPLALNMPVELWRRVLVHDRVSGTTPLVRLAFWKDLLTHGFCEAFYEARSDKVRLGDLDLAATAILERCDEKLTQTDSVVIARPVVGTQAAEGRYWRCRHEKETEVFVCPETNSRLTYEMLAPQKAVVAGSCPSVVLLASDAEQSLRTVKLKSAAIWRERRSRCTVFPDNDEDMLGFSEEPAEFIDASMLALCVDLLETPIGILPRGAEYVTSDASPPAFMTSLLGRLRVTVYESLLSAYRAV